MSKMADRINGVIALEGVVDKGQIRLTTNVRLPDNTKVYVIVPDLHIEQGGHIYSPRLLHPEQAGDFKMEVIEETS